MSDKNMVEVADKAVDKIAGGIESVARAVEKVAPHVWEVLVRQAMLEGVGALIVAVVICVFVGLAAPWAWKRRPVKEDMFDDSRGFASVAIVVIAVGGFVSSVSLIYEGTLRTLNPEYYAAKQLIDAAGGK